MKTSAPAQASPTGLSRHHLWLWLSVAGAVLAIAGNVVGLSVGSIYERLKPAFLAQALAQDVADLAVIGPAWLILAALALRGSLRAFLMWLGVLTFTVYNYVIYAVAVPFGPLLPLWISVLGLTLYALIGGLTAADNWAVKSAYTDERPVRATAWFLIVAGILFALLWLSEDVPAWLKGTTPQSLIDMGMLTNPVHIMDLAFFLPALWITGSWLLKAKPMGYTVAPAFIVFIILTGIPILITPFIQARLGQVPGWGVIVPIGVLVAVSLAVLIWLISAIHETPHKS